MGNVFRCYVEKKPGFAVEAEHLFGELRHTLGLTGLTGVRVLRRYDVEGVDAAVYAAARTTVLSEPQVDALWDEVMPPRRGSTPCSRWRPCPASTTSGPTPAPSASR